MYCHYIVASGRTLHVQYYSLHLRNIIDELEGGQRE